MEPCVQDEQHPHLGGNIDGGDSFTFCPGGWKYLVDEVVAKVAGQTIVTDIGCGQGHALKWFQDHGCCVQGVEGLQSNVDKANELLNANDVAAGRLPIDPVECHDIQNGPTSIRPADLVWCCELVEHIEEKYIDNLLPLLIAPVLAMTHAEVGQDGHHHVNCQPAEYWVERLASVGMVYDMHLTPFVKMKDKHNNHFQWHGLMFRKG